MDVAASLALPLANTVPSAEAVSPAAGTMDMASRADHKHERLTSAQNVTLDANGMATITFSRTFAAEPVIVFGALGTGTAPVPDFRGEFIKTGAIYTGLTVYGQRNRSLPTIAPLSGGIVLLANLITGLNTILTGLSGFAPYEAAAGSRVSVTAIQASQ